MKLYARTIKRLGLYASTVQEWGKCKKCLMAGKVVKPKIPELSDNHTSHEKRVTYVTYLTY